MAKKRGNPLSGKFRDPPTEAETPTPDQTEQDTSPTEQIEIPASPMAADTPAPEQSDQSDAPAEQAEAPAAPVAADAATPEQNSPDIRFVKIADIKPLAGTYVKEIPKEDYSDLIASIKEHGLEKPVILRGGANGDFQLVDGFHRCEALKQAGHLEVRAEVYDMTQQDAYLDEV